MDTCLLSERSVLFPTEGLWWSCVRETMKSNHQVWRLQKAGHTQHDDDVAAPLSPDIVDPLACLVKTVCVCYVIHHHCNCAVADVTEKQITCYGCVSNYKGRIPTIIHMKFMSKIMIKGKSSTWVWGCEIFPALQCPRAVAALYGPKIKKLTIIKTNFKRLLTDAPLVSYRYCNHQV